MSTIQQMLQKLVGVSPIGSQIYGQLQLKGKLLHLIYLDRDPI
jgi:hypothetical protein